MTDRVLPARRPQDLACVGIVVGIALTPGSACGMRGRCARIASVTIFAVSAQACVPPLPYCFTASPTHHRPSMPVSRGKS